MGGHAYPRISARNKLRSVPMCCVCGAVAVWRVEIQVSYMRGDDEVRFACANHGRSRTAEELLSLKQPTSHEQEPT